jgi:hypothetical protein
VPRIYPLLFLSFVLFVGFAHIFASVQHRSYDFVVSRTSAQITRQGIADFLDRWVWVPIQQRFRRDQKPGRANTALQRRVLNELSLQDMQFAILNQTFDRCYLSPFCFSSQYQARTHQLAINGHAAGAAIARPASFFSPGQSDSVAQCIQERFAARTNILNRIPIHCGAYMYSSHYLPPAR